MWRKLSSLYLLYSLVLLLMAWETLAGSRQNNAIANLEENSKAKIIDDLNCFVCHSESHTECFNYTEDAFDSFRTQCTVNDTNCMVRRFSFTLTNDSVTSAVKTFALKRMCTNKCENGCVIMGERTRLYVCTQCCQDHYCNIGNDGSSIHRQSANAYYNIYQIVTRIFPYYNFVYVASIQTLLPTIISATLGIVAVGVIA